MEDEPRCRIERLQHGDAVLHQRRRDRFRNRSVRTDVLFSRGSSSAKPRPRSDARLQPSVVPFAGMIMRSVRVPPAGIWGFLLKPQQCKIRLRPSQLRVDAGRALQLRTQLRAAWERWLLALRATGLLGEHTLAPSSLQPTDVDGWVLVKRRNVA